MGAIQVERVAPSEPVYGKSTLLDCIGDTMILLRDNRAQLLRYSYGKNQLYRFDLSTLPRSTTLDHSILWGKNKGYVFRTITPDGGDKILPLNGWITAVRLEGGRIGTWFYQGSSLFKVAQNKPITSDLEIWPARLFQDKTFQQEFEPLVVADDSNQLQLSMWNNNMLADRSGLIWLATGGIGLRKVNPRQISFRNYFPGRSISSIRELPGNRLWVRAFNNITYLLDVSTGHVKEDGPGTPFGDKWFYEILVAGGHQYWAMEAYTPEHHEKRLRLLDKKTGKLVRFDTDFPFIEGVPEKIIEDRDGNVWISAHRGGLYRHRPGQPAQLDSFSYAYLFPGDNQGTLRSTAIAQDARGDMWIGTNMGLVRLVGLEENKPQFSLLKHDSKKNTTLSMDWVSCICPDPNQPEILWLGTRGGGLNRFHIPTGTFTFWTESPNGFPDNVVYGIIPDQQGNLWCSTNRGICRFSPAKNTFISYQESNGLLSTEFNTNSYLRTSDGRFWFGGVNGLNAFRPEEIEPQSAPPPVAIAGIKVRGVERLPDEAAALTLPFEENNVQFEFAVLDFANPATNRFRHRLRGIDKDWVYDGTVHTANYSALPPGRYVLELQGATADSPWNEQSVVFNLVIRAPWYRSFVAYLLYFLLAGAAVFGYIRYREKMIKLEHSAMLNQRESARLKEFEGVKNQFFANVAHELRTPLTVIFGLADRLRRGEKSDSVEENARQILKQSEHLLQLTNQVLDLARLESHQFQLHLNQGNVADFIVQQITALTPLAASKDIQLKAVCATPELWTAFDKPQLQNILNNLITNAVRHTPPGGAIQVSVGMEPDGDSWYLRVADTGEGIDPEDLPHVFDRYFQGRRSGGTVGASGIGLTLTRDLVQLMGGTVAVESMRGEGTVFSIVLPLVHEAASASTMLLPTRADDAGSVQPAPVPAGDMPLLLLMEDNPDVLAFLRLCLQPHYQLVVAIDGAAGIEKAFELIPDIILTDVAMPFKDGYEVTSILKNDERTSHIPIVMLTAKADPRDRMEGRRRGANAYLTKPFDEPELLLVLHNLLHLQQQWSNRYRYFLQDRPELAVTGHHPEDVQIEDQFMQKVNGIFEANYHEDDFNLDRLCRMLNMSSSQLDRKFKALTDQSPMQMLRTFRLQKAQLLLRNHPNISIKEVCFRTGFKSPAHFSRLYSKEFGTPPSEG